jgi:hypothetical protein
VWVDIVSQGNKQNLVGLSFYDFLNRLNKAAERNILEQQKKNKK